jgi:PST family polysaccharide transporter
MRLIGSICVVLLSCLIVFFLDGENDKELLMVVFLTSFNYIFLSFDVIDLYFQSRVESKYSVIAKFIAFIVSCILRVIALLCKMPLVAFVAIATFEALLGAIGLIIFYIQKGKYAPTKWSINYQYLKLKLHEAWPLILSGMVIMIYMRIDQIMIKHLVGEKSVGIYSAAVRISEVWYIIPTAIANSVYPNLIALRLKDTQMYLKRFELLYSVSFIISFVIGVIVMICDYQNAVWPGIRGKCGYFTSEYMGWHICIFGCS